LPGEILCFPVWLVRHFQVSFVSRRLYLLFGRSDGDDAPVRRLLRAPVALIDGVAELRSIETSVVHHFRKAEAYSVARSDIE
jgi:hypothetical protein